MQTIPLSAVSNQTLFTTLNAQDCQINVYQKQVGLFLDLFVSNTPVVSGVVGRNASMMIINTYLGFVGDLMWYDTQGLSDPYYTGLGSRFQLIYFLPSDIPTTSVY